MEIFPFQAPYGCHTVTICMYFIVSSLSLSGFYTAMLVRSLLMKKREKDWPVIVDVFDIFATQYALVYDVTDADCLPTKWQHS